MSKTSGAVWLSREKQAIIRHTGTLENDTQVEGPTKEVPAEAAWWIEPKAVNQPAIGRSGRSVQLDALRGIAILLVLGRHQRIDPNTAGALSATAAFWYRFGWTGVDLFFVLSGFLVGGLLLKEILRFGDLNVGRFLVRRGWKIWPSYYLYLAWVAVRELWIGPTTSPTHLADVWHSLWPSVFSIQNYLWLVKPHLWSLGVEEHFYLLLPIALVCFARTPALLTRPRFLVGLVIVLLTCLFLRTITSDVADLQNRYYTHLRLDSLAFGFLLAYIFHVRPLWWEKLAAMRSILFALGLVAIAPAAILSYLSRLLGSFGLTALYLGYGAILVACVAESAEPHWLDRIFKGWVGQRLAFIGLSSYSIYLWHRDMGGVAATMLKYLGHIDIDRSSRNMPELHWLIVASIFVSVSVGGGVLIGRIVEIPILRLRDRLLPARARLTNFVKPVAGPAEILLRQSN